ALLLTRTARHFLARVRIPEPDRAIGAAGDERAAVLAERQADHRFGMAVQRRDLGAGGPVPDLDRAIRSAGSDFLAVRADRDRLEPRPHVPAEGGCPCS